MQLLHEHRSGHCHLKKVGEIICDAIREAGGVPYEFNTIAVCDGIAMGHSGMKYSLASREIIADASRPWAPLIRSTR